MKAKPVQHPGLIVAAALSSAKITAYRCALDVGETAPRIYELVKGKRPLTPLLAAKLEIYLGMNAMDLLAAQNRFDLANPSDKGREALTKVAPLQRGLK